VPGVTSGKFILATVLLDAFLHGQGHEQRQMLAERVMEHLEQTGFEIDEAEQVMRKRPPSANHG